jgi:predicted DNA-binding mobile mystery protein A
MRERERKAARKKLDEEMRPFRQAGRVKGPTNELLRAVRQALGIPVAEIAGKMGVRSSGVLEREMSEAAGTITMKFLERQAGAMGCKLVYGIVPEGGKTLERLAEERYWEGEMGKAGAEGLRD